MNTRRHVVGRSCPCLINGGGGELLLARKALPVDHNNN